MKNERESYIRLIEINPSKVISKEMDYLIEGSKSELEINPFYFNTS